MAKIVSIPLAIIMSIFSFLIPSNYDEIDKEQWNTNYDYVFVTVYPDGVVMMMYIN